MTKKAPIRLDFYRPHSRVTIDCSCPPEKRLVQQSARDECDINKIMQRFSADDLAAHAAQFQGQYGDFVHETDYHSALSQARAAQEMFMTLPANVRAVHENDPGRFVEWVEGASEDDMREAGLLPPASVQSPGQTPAKPAPEPEPAPEPAPTP